MFYVTWDPETGGVRLSTLRTKETLGISPRPVFFEELDLLKLNNLGWTYPRCKEPLLWACNKQYFYRGQMVFEVKGANIYDPAQVIFQDGFEKLTLTPVDVPAMLKACEDEMFLAESEALEFIRNTYIQYASARESVERVKANQLDYEAMVAKLEKETKKKMAIVKQDCDSFDIMEEENAKQSGKKTYVTTKIDKFLASFSGGKDSQVVLDLCTRAIPPSEFEVIYSDTGYELPTSLTLWEEVQTYYKAKFPELRFRTARNHESVLNYWDKIGTPSDTHRWCCSVMKTAPLHRLLKLEGSNQQAKVMAFEGSRGEESVRRSSYERIGKGVKHANVINARPVFYWNTVEIFMYLFQYNLPINQAYRKGKPRVGCLICPFSSEWDDMIVNTCFHDNLRPFTERLERWSKMRGVQNVEDYIKNHKWKLRASGKYMDVPTSVNFSMNGNDLKASIQHCNNSIETWLPVLGEFILSSKENKKTGEINYKSNIYSFEIEYNNKNKTNCQLTIHNVTDLTFIGAIKRVIYKSAYCIQCEACEVECPTGALSVVPTVTVDGSKCVHCLKCLSFHSYGCVVADSLSMANNTSSSKMSGISGYGTFGLRDEWLSEFFVMKNDYWENNGLGKKQVPSFKSWLKDASIIDEQSRITDLGTLLADIYQDMPDLVWEIIWINLCHQSPLVSWFICKVPFNTNYSKNSIMDLYKEEYSEGFTTFEYSLGALFNMFSSSPLGEQFGLKIECSKNIFVKNNYEELSREALAYSLFKYSEKKEARSFRLSDLYSPDNDAGVFKEFGTSKNAVEKLLRSLNSDTNRVLNADLNMGLDHISLYENMSSLKVLSLLTNVPL